ncbi:MAG: O-antigen ligase family protein [bacterium]
MENSTPNDNTRGSGRQTVFGAYITFGLPILLFLITTVYIGSSLDPFLPPKAFLLRLYALGGAMLLVYRIAMRGGYSVKATPAGSAAIVFLLWCAVSLFYARNRDSSIDALLNLVCAVFIYFMVSSEIRSLEAAKRLLAYSLAPVFAIAAFAALDLMRVSFFPWDYLIANKVVSVFSVFNVPNSGPRAWQHYFDGRVSASFGNPVYLAGFMTLMLAPAWGLYITRGGRARRLFIISAAILIEIILVATFTRSAWISAAISMCVFFLFARKCGKNAVSSRLGAAAALIVLAGVIGAFAVKGGINPNFAVGERIESIADSTDGSRLQRTLIWKTAWEMVKANPVVGVGLGNYYIQHPVYQRKFFSSKYWAPYISYPDRVHNEFLDLWAETGLIGAILAAAALAFFMAAGLRAVKRGGDEGRLASGLLAGGGGMLLYGMVQFPLHVMEVLVYSCVFAGLIESLSRGERCVEQTHKKWRSARASERLLLAAVLILLFAVAAKQIAKPSLGNIAFFWGLSHADEEPERAIEMMEAGLFLCPNDAEMPIRYGMTLNRIASKAGSKQARLDIYMKVWNESQTALARNPAEGRLYDNLGVVYIRLNEPRKALAALKREEYYSPPNAALFYNMGIAYYMLQRYNTAIINYARALEADSALPGVNQNLGLAYMRTGRPEEAVKAYGRELKLDAENAQALNSLGLAQSALGRSGDAISAYRRAVAEEPGFKEARGNLAIELIKRGEYSEAAAELEKVIAADPGSGIARYHLGRAYKLMGRVKDGDMELKLASELMLKAKKTDIRSDKKTGGAER